VALFVVAYPQISQADYAWIQAIRAEHDKQYSLIEPHFTLVFATQKPLPELLAHVEEVSRTFAAFRFVMRCAMPVKDFFSPQTHLFLVPDEGFSQIVRLHDYLYSGLLASELRLDVPFIPHVTIGSFSALNQCKQVCDEINQTEFALEGQINALDIIESRQATRTLAKFFLKNLKPQ
jgi:2'-5' RNA ligase